MFEILNDPYVYAMLSLAKENGDAHELRALLDTLDMQKLFALSKEHELHGALASNIVGHRLCDLPEDWKRAYKAEAERLTFLKDKAKAVCQTMDEAGIHMVILKNGGIMADIIKDAAACPMEDIDSLVKKEDFKKAHEILIQNGFVFKFRSAYEFERLEEAFRDGSTEYYLPMTGGEVLWFELSHRAIAGRWIRPDKEPDTAALMEAAYHAPGTKVGILAAEDNLLQVCIHTAKHSYVRSPGLRLHMDVDRIVCHKTIDWDVFLKKAADAHVKTAVYFSLLIPQRIFGTPIPEAVLSALKPKAAKEKRIRRLLSRAGLLHPGEKKFSKLQFLAFQTSLYDSFADLWAVLYPKNHLLHDLYQYKSPLLTPYYILLRGLDLVGIRKKKKD